MNPSDSRRPCRRRRHGDAGFTLVELMATLAIIVVLISILIPTVKKVRDSAKVAGVKNQVSQIAGAIDRFQLEQGKFPGPLSDDHVSVDVRNPGGLGPDPRVHDLTGTVLADGTKITQAENLVLGLFGGLKWVNTGGINRLTYDPAMVGRGMIGMNANQPKKSTPYLEDLKMLSPFPGNTQDPSNPNWPGGSYKDDAGTANDSRIPEIVDNFPNPMPLLYLRARPGANGIIVEDIPEASPAVIRQYVLSDIAPYTIGASGSIGEGKSIRAADYKNAPKAATSGFLPHGLTSVDPTRNMDKGDTANYQYPYDAFAYFASPSDPAPLANRVTPRKKDTYILISAGLDRVYGTADDITNFGSVVPD